MSLQIEFDEVNINVLIIENSKFFYSVLNDLFKQINRMEGKFLLSENNVPLDLSKEADLIAQYVPFDTNRKNLLSKLYSKVKEISVSPEYYVSTSEISMEIYNYLRMLSNEINSELDYEYNIDIITLCKAVNLRFSEEYSSLSERLIEYMINVEQFEKRKLFIFINLHDYVGKRELEDFYDTVVGHKINILLIESHEREGIRREKKLIIDKDMCEIN